MYPIYEFEDEILFVLREFGIEEVKLLKPPAGKGDAALPCFGGAKKMNRNPFELAEELESKVNSKDLKLVKSCKAENGYLNFFINEKLLAEKTIHMIEDKGEEYGSGEKKKEKILLEHTSANPTGPLHIGRARNPIIGDTLARILRFYGYDVKTEYYIDDVGTQVAILAWGVKNLKNLRLEDQPDERRDHVLVKYYQEADKLRGSDENVDREIRELLKKYERGDEQTVKFLRGSMLKLLAEYWRA
jgi:Arginyl-tRNA synthetase